VPRKFALLRLVFRRSAAVNPSPLADRGGHRDRVGPRRGLSRALQVCPEPVEDQLAVACRPGLAPEPLIGVPLIRAPVDMSE